MQNVQTLATLALVGIAPVLLTGCDDSDKRQLVDANKTIADLREVIKSQGELIRGLNASFTTLTEQVQKTVSACAEGRDKGDNTAWIEQMRTASAACKA